MDSRLELELQSLEATGARGAGDILTACLHALNVKRVERRPLHYDAALLSEQGGYVIHVNSLYPLVRQRMSVAHELAHLLLGKAWNRPFKRQDKPDDEVERLCNQIAGRILAPDREIREFFSSAV